MSVVAAQIDEAVPVRHFVKGVVVEGAADEYRGPGGIRFTTPALDLDRLAWSRQAPGPAFDVPLSEIKAFLAETGQRIRRDADGFLAEAFEHMQRASSLDRGVLERSYADLPRLFDPAMLDFIVEGEIGGGDVLDGWREVTVPSGRKARIRAFPARLVHILAGNTPGVAALTIVRGALGKGVNLLKLPSNDLFSATAILRIMAGIDADHPVVRSFSAVYWRGGDAAVERMLFRPQFFDKLVAWGGEAAIKSAKNYIGPGFELVAFDPKTSISLIGREALATADTIAEAAELAALDATSYNQSACTASRIQFVEGSVEDVDRFCAALQERLGVERHTASEIGPRVPADLREEIDALRDMAPYYRVWGDFSGRGIVIRSDEPVDFYPDYKIVNVVHVASLEDAAAHANVATQTVGVFPPSRKAALRDGLASAGVQRIVSLGAAGTGSPGIPHDGFLPLARLVRWVNDED